MTEKEKALTEFLADKIFASGEEGFNAGWDAAVKLSQSYRVDVVPYEFYNPQSGAIIQQELAVSDGNEYARKVLLAEELLRQGHITSHEQFQKFIKGLDW